VIGQSSGVIEKWFQYAIQYSQMMIYKEKMFFLDETEIQIWSRVTYGRSAEGTRAVKRVKSIRSRNYSIATAMNMDSLFIFEIQDKPYNSEDFAYYLNKLIHHLTLNDIDGAYLIMDNIRFHKTELVIDLIQSYGHNPVFLPPYSPFLNPIENLFNQWKNLVKRSELKSEDQLYDAVHYASDNITSENCSDYFKNMETYLSRCLNRETIDN